VPSNFRRSPARMGRTRRRTTWATVNSTFSIAAANDYVIDDLLASYDSASGSVMVGITVLRSHLLVTAQTQSNATSNFTLGIIRGQMTDVGSNIAGAPAPNSDLYEDWALWSRYFTDFNGNFNPLGTANTVHIDLKAKRRLEELDQRWNMVIQSASWASFPAVFQVTGRVLIGLP